MNIIICLYEPLYAYFTIFKSFLEFQIFGSTHIIYKCNVVKKNLLVGQNTLSDKIFSQLSFDILFNHYPFTVSTCAIVIINHSGICAKNKIIQLNTIQNYNL
jgi:hypothetical protein